ncbi:proline racemase family protein [Labrenzia sp. 011]|uniref:proline racemase family protein n=1 Tax=Labrenzia sp. 011 TaxID=2171494 RepID=UPI000D513356|nr:proline racemase family protein [Labrenzia sp. 011]PVB62317.1 hypothetical protein DCO57_08460 [Labrenzia sp. 011]
MTDSDTTGSRRPYSIGHAAKMTGVAVSTLRSWEQLGLIKPHKSASGHRSFTTEDLDRIRKIEQMRRVSGMSLSSIRRTFDQDAEEATSAAPAKAERQKIDYDRIGESVRTMRKEAGLSLRELSDLTEIGVSHLSMFERGAAFLSPARLNAIAAAFNRSVVELLGGTSHNDIPIVRKGGGRVVSTFSPGVSIEQLTVAERLMDVEVWTIEPGRESDGFYSHEGEELLYVLDGQLEVTLCGREPVTIGAGDSAYFDSRIDHRWHNTGTCNAVILWVNTDVERLGTMHFERRGRRLELGTSSGSGLGEGGLNIDLPSNSETYRVLETHTAGHPTRILIEPLKDLAGSTVAERRQSFMDRHDHLRAMLLQEPRGHVGSFGLVPVPSQVADFGAFFITSYGYPDFCGHAVIGYAKALDALGQLNGKTRFSVEVPGGTIELERGATPDTLHLALPVTSVQKEPVNVEIDGRIVPVRLTYGANTHAVIDASHLGWSVTTDMLQTMLAAAMTVREALSASSAPQPEKLDSVLFCQTVAGGPERIFLAIDRQRYDRSPGVGGVAARMAVLCEEERMAPGDTLEAESIFGGRLNGTCLRIAETAEDRPAYAPTISGRAHLNGMSTLILEPDDPLRSGFL